MVTDAQVRKLFRELHSGTPLATAARRADMDDKTARKYRTRGTLPSAAKTPRAYRTRTDPFDGVWPAVEQRLAAEPRLTAKTLFDWVKAENPDRIADTHRRTFERRVRQWKAAHGPAQDVKFRQAHHAGDLATSDFTSMNALGVTVQGHPFDHLAYHFVLTYSNWESVTVCASESFEALADGLQNALWELGGVPGRHRSDSLSAAVNNLPDPRGVPQVGPNNWGSAFLPAVFQGTAFTADKPIPHLERPAACPRRPTPTRGTSSRNSTRST